MSTMFSETESNTLEDLIRNFDEAIQDVGLSFIYFPKLPLE